MQQDEILSDLIALLRNFNAKSDAQITQDSYFFQDLEMASIDAVVFAERIEQFYAKKFPFNAFLAKQKHSNEGDMQLKELVQFLSQHLP